ncbi:MAG: threonine synthase, partial [Anaerolineales bacterium]
MNQKFTGYKCSLCDAEYSADEVIYTCRIDGGNLDIIYDYSKLRRDLSSETITSSKEESLWRYSPLLPVQEPQSTGTPLHAAGWTPNFALPGLRQQLGLPSLWVKDESRNPTA